MKVEKEKLDQWKNLYTHGDIEKIRLSMPENKRVTAENIRICVKKGEFANLNVFESVVKFYKKKEKRLAKLVN